MTNDDIKQVQPTYKRDHDHLTHNADKMGIFLNSIFTSLITWTTYDVGN